MLCGEGGDHRSAAENPARGTSPHDRGRGRSGENHRGDLRDPLYQSEREKRAGDPILEYILK